MFGVGQGIRIRRLNDRHHIPSDGLELLLSMGRHGGLNPVDNWPHCAENLLPWSERTTGWTNFNVTAEANTTPNPRNGEATADSLLEEAATDSHLIYRSMSLVEHRQYNLSVHAKGNGRNWLILRSDITGSWLNNWFDLSSGALGTIEPGYSAAIAKLAGGWCRCSVTVTSNATAAKNLQIGIAPANEVISYAGDITKGLFVWGVQFTPGLITPRYEATEEGRQQVWDWSGNARHAQVGSDADPGGDANDPGDGIVDSGGPLIAAARGHFDGTNDYLDVSSLPLAGDWSFLAAIRADDNTSRGLWRNGTSAPNISLDANGKVSYAGGGTVAATNAVAQAEWHTIGITKQGTTITHYLDGAPNGSGTSGSANAFTALRIGYDGAAYYQGMLPFFSAHSDALDDDEMRNFHELIKQQWNLDRRRKRNLTLP